MDAAMREDFRRLGWRWVPASGLPEVRWTVAVHRGDAFPGWPWLDRILALNWQFAGAGIVIMLALATLPLPSMIYRALRYHWKRRSDWDVLVYPGQQPDYRPRKALLIENHPNRQAAVERATDLWRHLDAGATWHSRRAQTA